MLLCQSFWKEFKVQLFRTNSYFNICYSIFLTTSFHHTRSSLFMLLESSKPSSVDRGCCWYLACGMHTNTSLNPSTHWHFCAYLYEQSCFCAIFAHSDLVQSSRPEIIVYFGDGYCVYVTGMITLVSFANMQHRTVFIDYGFAVVVSRFGALQKRLIS